ncbi:kinase-like domain-containing protein [Rhizophagus irregularis DAOM 181602=DAOM 197198]|nr:kinase-like domain-containing protein [Rhizophagus irregularis DAOM 181602=DAOM 197198]
MATIRKEIVKVAINRAYALLDFNIQNNIEKQHVFKIQTVLAEKSLTKDEKSYAVKDLNNALDYFKIVNNQGTKRICGCSEIYTALWIDGNYEEWDPKEKQLKRCGRINVVLKKLENVESANKSWFDEGISHLHISSKTSLIVRCYGLTQNPFNGNYMLVIDLLRVYTQNENEQRIISKFININNSQLNTRFNVNSSSTNSSFFGRFSVSSSNWNISSSRVYNFENLPEPRNATKVEQDAYHSIQFDFDLQDGMIIEKKSNKRSYFNDDEKDLAYNSNKKVNSNNNEEIQYHEIGYQYMQRTYATI